MANGPASPPDSKSRGNHILWVSVVAFGLMIFALPTVIVLVCGMLPTFVAFIIDRQKERYATCCVASMNLCGIFPSLLDLWTTDHSLGSAVTILTDVFSLFTILGATAFGWVMFSAIPPVISSFLGVIAQRRVARLRTEQRRLINEWGEIVANKVEKKAPVTENEELPQTDKAAKPEQEKTEQAKPEQPQDDKAANAEAAPAADQSDAPSPSPPAPPPEAPEATPGNDPNGTQAPPSTAPAAT